MPHITKKTCLVFVADPRGEDLKYERCYAAVRMLQAVQFRVVETFVTG